MKFSRTILSILLIVTSVSAFAQAWSDAYNEGLGNIRTQKWTEARASFQKAAAVRGEDQSNGTRLPGPITEQRFWRNGSPYSPNFAAAYTGLKAAELITDEAPKMALTRQVASEFEALLSKGQLSNETFYFLAMSYANLRDVSKQQELEARYKESSAKLNWKVDGELIIPEDKSAIAALAGGASSGNGGTIIGANPTAPTARLSNKYALVIGNSDTRFDTFKLPFGATDSMLMREKLVQFSGYDEKNVDVVTNATAAQIRAAASALAQRVTPESTVFIYYSGGGANLDGKDFLAGVETSSATDSSTMVPKGELYSMFIKNGCTIFAFFQVNRPVVSGRYFGMEVPMVGAIAQTQATLPGGTIGSIVRNGQPVGLFTDAMCGVITEFRSNRIPIQEFGWRVFDWMRGGRNGNSGTGSTQTMTLPILNNLDDRSGF